MAPDDIQMAANAAKAISPLVEKLLEKFSVRRWYDPVHARRMNKVENQNRVADAKTDVEVARIRAEARLIDEQCNIDDTVQVAASMLSVDADVEGMNQDWVNYVVDEVKNVTDDEMRVLWARIIAGEAEDPGRFSRRVLDEVSRLSKEEAKAFTELAGYVWCFPVTVDGKDTNLPILVIDESNTLIALRGKLVRTALVSRFDTGVKYLSGQKGTVLHMHYYSNVCEIKILTDDGVVLNGSGHTFVLSNIGEALFPICGGEPIPGEFERRVEEWSQGKALDVVRVTISAP